MCCADSSSPVRTANKAQKSHNRLIQTVWGDLLFEVSPKIVDREYLTEAELQSIVLRKFDFERLDLVRDLFVFAYYTGLASTRFGNSGKI